MAVYRVGDLAYQLVAEAAYQGGVGWRAALHQELVRLDAKRPRETEMDIRRWVFPAGLDLRQVVLGDASRVGQAVLGEVSIRPKRLEVP